MGSLLIIEKLLRHVRRCVCLRPATYARAMCDLCDECAAKPDLEWGFDNDSAKEECKLSQAEVVREAIKYIEEHPLTKYKK